MSRFFTYCELPDTNTTDYACFKQVGKFIVPESIFFSNIKIDFQKKLIQGAIISDFSKQSANDYFSKISSKNTHLLNSTLLDFLNQRLSFPCIQAYLTPFIMDNTFDTESTLNLDKTVEIININENPNFDFTIFQKNAIFHLIK